MVSLLRNSVKMGWIFCVTLNWLRCSSFALILKNVSRCVCGVPVCSNLLHHHQLIGALAKAQWVIHDHIKSRLILAGAQTDTEISFHCKWLDYHLSWNPHRGTDVTREKIVLRDPLWFDREGTCSISADAWVVDTSSLGLSCSHLTKLTLCNYVTDTPPVLFSLHMNHYCNFKVWRWMQWKH